MTRLPLAFSVFKGHLPCAATLLTRGANPRHADDSGVTALHLAACGGGVLVARILLAAGADALAVNQDGQTPADVARSV